MKSVTSTKKRIGRTPLILFLLITGYLLLQLILCNIEVKKAYRRLETYPAKTLSLSYGNLTYVDQGAGETILVAHGMSGGYDQGFDTLKDRTSAYRVLAPSRFGYLGSDLPEDATPAAQAKAFVALLDQLEIDRVFILGTSAGGTLAIRFALDYPERTKGLILYSSAAPLAEKPESYVEYQGPPPFLLNNYAMWLFKPLFQPIMGMSSETIYSILPINERHKGMSLDATMNNPDMAKNFEAYPIESLKVPSLIFHAQDDLLADYAQMEQVVYRFPNHTFIFFEKGGHLMEGHGAEIQATLDQFIKQNQ